MRLTRRSPFNRRFLNFEFVFCILVMYAGFTKNRKRRFAPNENGTVTSWTRHGEFRFLLSEYPSEAFCFSEPGL